MIFQKNILIPIVLLNLCTINASDTFQLDSIKQYPFNNIDKELFYNKATQKIESPYSSALVQTFSTCTLATIEQDTYNLLHAYALKRSNMIGTLALQAYEQCPSEDTAQKLDLRHIITTATNYNEKLKSIKLTECYAQNVQLSHRDLMHVLQWSNGIKTVLLSMMGGGDVGFHAAFLTTISLDTSTLTAPTLLQKFIMQVHDQTKQKNIDNDHM